MRPPQYTDTEHGKLMRQMLPDLLIVLIERLQVGGEVHVTVDEIDNVGGKLLAFRLDPDKREFIFSVGRKV